jgi:iron complex outermembrane receptor protein
LLFTPTEKLSIRLIGTWNHQGFNTMSPVVTSIYNPAALQARMAAAGYTLNTSDASQRYINIDAALNARTDTYATSGTVDYDLGKGGTITSITAWEHWKCYTNNDNDYTQLNAIPDYGSCNNEQQFSQELRWSTPRARRSRRPSAASSRASSWPWTAASASATSITSGPPIPRPPTSRR